MSNLHLPDAIKSHGDKLEAMAGHRGEHPSDRAARIAGNPTSPSATGDAARAPEEKFIGAPARQVSNYGNIKGK
jgi:hypothetical protein